jgi:translation elongation factor EF-Ts
MLSFVKLPVVDFDNIGHNDQLKKLGESVNAEITSEGLHDPNKLGNLQERRRRELMNLYRKSIQDRGENWIARKPKATSAEVAKYNNLSVFGSRGLLIQWSSPGA